MATAHVNGMVFDYVSEGPDIGTPLVLLRLSGEPQLLVTAHDGAGGTGLPGNRPDQRGYSPLARPTSTSDYRSRRWCPTCSA